MNQCHDCNSSYATPGTCNCFAVGGKRYAGDAPLLTPCVPYVQFDPPLSTQWVPYDPRTRITWTTAPAITGTGETATVTLTVT